MIFWNNIIKLVGKKIKWGREEGVGIGERETEKRERIGCLGLSWWGRKSSEEEGKRNV